MTDNKISARENDLPSKPGSPLENLESQDEYAPDRLLVRYKTDTGSSQDLGAAKADLYAMADASVLVDYTPLGIPGLELVRLGTKNITEAMGAFEQSPFIEYVEPDYICRIPEIRENIPSGKVSETYPNDTYFDFSWGLHNTGQFGGTPGVDINAPEAWSVTTGSEEVVIAVIDTGIDYTHPDLAENMWINTAEIPDNGIDDDGNGYIDDYRGYSFDPMRPDPMATHFHGTHCAGIIGAVGNNGIGVCGVNWHVKIMPLNAYNVTVDGLYVSAMIRAYLYAEQMGVRITSHSYGSRHYSRAQSDAINATHAIMVCAAGNYRQDNDQYPLYPASYNNPDIISVAAMNPYNTKWSESNWGRTSVDLMAPGMLISSTTWHGGYLYLSGTSMATPHVAGVAGLILALYPNLTNQDVIDRILMTTDHVDSDQWPTVTNGRVNAAHALYWNTTPEISAITPSAGVNNHTLSISNLSGKNLFNLTMVNLTSSGRKNVTALNVTAFSPDTITCMMPLTGVLPGRWNVTVTNPYGQTAMLPDGFTVTEGPVLPPVTYRIFPGQGQAGSDVSFTLTGENFDYVNIVNLSREGMENISTVGILQGDNLTGIFHLPYFHTTDQWNVSVNQGGLLSHETVPFTILAAAPAPNVTGIEPDYGYNTRVAAVAIMGSNFIDGCRADLIYPDGEVIPNMSPVIFSNSTFVNATFKIQGRMTGSVSLILINPDGQECPNPPVFTILDGWDYYPEIIAINPTSAWFDTITEVEINGSYLSPEMEVYLGEWYSRNPCAINRSPRYNADTDNISASLDLQRISAGLYEIWLMNTTTGTYSYPYPFSIMMPDPEINASSDRWTLTYPPGTRTYQARTNATYITQAKPGSMLNDVLVNNGSVGAVNTWTFTDLISNQTIRSIGDAKPGQVQVFFNASPRNGTAPLSVAFHDNSIGDPTSWYWEFGDGATNVTRNPDHTYSIPGIYTVSLRAMNSQSGGSGTWNQFITVTG